MRVHTIELFLYIFSKYPATLQTRNKGIVDRMWAYRGLNRTYEPDPRPD